MIALATSGIEPWQGLVAIGVLASAIGYLFKLYDSRLREAQRELIAQAKAHAEELGKRDTREATIRAEYEAKLREMAVLHVENVKEDHRENRVHEDGLRREFAEIVEGISNQAQKSAEGMTAVLEKLHTWLVRPQSNKRF